MNEIANMLHIYNSLTRKKETFVPIQPGKIGMYVCGNTVYDYCHLGHARSMVNFDIFVRFLRYSGYEVTYVRNITDIDDKIIQRANEREVSIQALTEQYIQAQNEDCQALGIEKPDFEPKATEHITSIINLIEKLIETGHAYVADNQDVYFHVDSFKEYGKLSHKDIEGLLAGARVDLVKEKNSPLDFVLWKSAKPHEPHWPSPWGPGRPGWHIECSAMAMEQLGEKFDIHGGGLDLQFPHHENEIAQSEAASGKTFANYWLHVGMLQVNNEKMAKSVGNFFTIRDILNTHQPEVLRYFLISSHYRSPLNYSEDNIINASKALTRLYQSLKNLPAVDHALDQTWIDQFNQAMNDDFNTPVALSVLFDLSRTLNREHNPVLASTLKYLGGIIGLLQDSPEKFLQSGLEEEDASWIGTLILERGEAKAQKNWARADEIRNILAEKGIELNDSAEGTTWRKV